jgi:hypothetical protein
VSTDEPVWAKSSSAQGFVAAWEDDVVNSELQVGGRAISESNPLPVQAVGDGSGGALESTQQQVLQAIQTALMPVNLRLPATDGMTQATITGITLPALWSLYINGLKLDKDIDYTVGGTGSAADPLQITFLPALGYAIAATDLIVITN